MREHLRDTFWFAPSLGLMCAFALWWAASELDAELVAYLQGEKAYDEVGDLIGIVEDAKTVVTTISSAMTTFIGVVFSISLVAVQMASGGFTGSTICCCWRRRAGGSRCCGTARSSSRPWSARCRRRPSGRSPCSPITRGSVGGSRHQVVVREVAGEAFAPRALGHRVDQEFAAHERASPRGAEAAEEFVPVAA